MSVMKILKSLSVIALIPAMIFAQGSIQGTVADANNETGLAGANIVVAGTDLGAAADGDGNFLITNVPAGDYSVKVSVIGYKLMSKNVTIVGNERIIVNFTLKTSTLQMSAVTVEGNMAQERETPVAFTNIGEAHIKNNFTVQDVPHLFANTPGIYVTSDGGAGMGDSKVMIRGFDEQRIAVMINNVPVNDPESKKVYWSNWGSLPSAAQGIQVQRGVGSSMYGSGALGGSINVVTKDAPAEKSVGLTTTLGQNGIMKYGFDFNSGLLGGKYAFISRVNYMQGNGWRNNTYYEGMQYYFSGMYFPNEKNTFKVILHGAPQFHSYSYYGMPAEDFDTYGYDFNGNPYILEEGLPDDQAARATTLMDVIFNRTEVGDSQQGGYVIGNGQASLDNNVYHKPQFEIHHKYNVSDDTKFTTTMFYSNGHGYGENLNKYYYLDRMADGSFSWDEVNDGGQYQYRSYSLHSQVGILSNLDTKIGEHKISTGVEYRYWVGRHAGEIINTFAKDNMSYYVGNTKQYFEQGELYYDYTTTKPQLTGFVHGLWKFGDLNIMTDVQVASVKYNIKEEMPNSNNYPIRYDAEAINHGGDIWTGTADWDHDGDSTTANVPVEYQLWDYERSFSYVSPKFGANYNINDNLNVFANYSLAVNEPRVKYFFNYGSPNETLEMENTKDLELGAGYTATIAGMPIDAKLNWYHIDFSNKSLQITDPTMANEPGFDYKGRRYLPIGTSVYSGTELSLNLVPMSGLSLGINYTNSSNIWGEPDDSEGSQYLYSKDDVVAGVDYTDTNDDGDWDTGEIAKHKDFAEKFGNKTEVGMPQQIFGATVNYSVAGFSIGYAMRNYSDIYVLENNSEMTVGAGEDDLYGTDDDEKSNTLPAATIMDVVLRYDLDMFKGIGLSLHMNNIMDTKYWQTGDSYGFKPGAARTLVFNAGITI